MASLRFPSWTQVTRPPSLDFTNFSIEADSKNPYTKNIKEKLASPVNDTCRTSGFRPGAADDKKKRNLEEKERLALGGVAAEELAKGVKVAKELAKAVTVTQSIVEEEEEGSSSDTSSEIATVPTVVPTVVPVPVPVRSSPGFSPGSSQKEAGCYFRHTDG